MKLKIPIQLNAFLLSVLVLSLFSCIGDDIIEDRVPAQLRITNPIDTLKAGEDYQLEFMYTNIIGQEEAASASFLSSDTNIAAVSATGLISGIMEGNCIISVSTESPDGTLSTQMPLAVGANTVSSSDNRTGTIRTTSSYVLEGTFSLSINGTDLILSMDSNFKTTSALPGLYVYLTNNPNSNANALEISEVTQFEGAHDYTVPAGTGLNDYSHVLWYCKPFGVKVGDGEFDN